MNSNSQLEAPPKGFTVVAYSINFMHDRIPIKRVFVGNRALALKVAKQLRRDPRIDSVGICTNVAKPQAARRARGDSSLRKFLATISTPIKTCRKKRVKPSELAEAQKILAIKLPPISTGFKTQPEFLEDAFDTQNLLEPVGKLPLNSPAYCRYVAALMYGELP